MGLFDWLTGKKKKAAAEAEFAAARRPVSLQDYSGIRVEVLSDKDELLFTARLAVSSGGLAELQLLSEDKAPPLEEEESIPVRLRGYDEETQRAVHLEGEAQRFSGTLWRVEKLRVTGSANDRAYYRQETDVAGDVMKVGQLNAMPEIKHCAVQNISVGGVGFQADTVYSIGDRLLLRSRILAGGGEIALFCTVRRIVQRRPGVYEYGCSFDMLDPYAEDQIAKAIMDMQMKRRRR